MKISNKTYDVLKWLSIIAIPAIEAFWLTVGKVWGWPHLTEIGTTIAAVGVLIGALIGVSCAQYDGEVDEDPEAIIEIHPEDESEAEG